MIYLKRHNYKALFSDIKAVDLDWRMTKVDSWAWYNISQYSFM